jgi:soluble lytic murein transglycosylase
VQAAALARSTLSAAARQPAGTGRDADAALRAHSMPPDAARWTRRRWTRTRPSAVRLAGIRALRATSHAPTDRGGAFHARHRGQPVAEAFRADWLAALAKRQEWGVPSAWNDASSNRAALRALRPGARWAARRALDA